MERDQNGRESAGRYLVFCMEMLPHKWNQTPRNSILFVLLFFFFFAGDSDSAAEVLLHLNHVQAFGKPKSCGSYESVSKSSPIRVWHGQGDSPPQLGSFVKLFFYGSLTLCDQVEGERVFYFGFGDFVDVGEKSATLCIGFGHRLGERYGIVVHDGEQKVLSVTPVETFRGFPEPHLKPDIDRALFAFNSSVELTGSRYGG